MRLQHFRRALFQAVALLTLCLCLPAETSMARAYRYYRAVTATSNTLTVRQPTANGRALQFAGGWVYCALGCTETFSVNGTLSGGTPVTPGKLDLRAPAPTATLTTDGTVGSPENVIAIPLPASGSQTIGGGQYIPFTAGSPGQITLGGSGASQDIRVYLTWIEP